VPRRWVPNVITVIGLVAGFAAIGAGFLHLSGLAVLFILGAALVDSVDGQIARRLNISGVARNLDLLADLISFGIAPAVVAYFLDFAQLGWNGCILAAVFPVCGLLRLLTFSKFQVKTYYVGLPLPGSGALLAIWAYLAQSMPVVLQAMVMLVLAALMVSTVRLPRVRLVKRSA